MNILIKGGKVVTPELIVEADLLIEEGKVTHIGNIQNFEAEETIDARGKLVFPGAVDEHVHMREPGLTYKDDFYNGTRAAAAGGVTTIIEMPNTIPPVDSPERVKEKVEILKEKAFVDFAIYGVLHDSNVESFKEIINAGAVGFKVFMGEVTGNMPQPSLKAIYRMLELSAETGVTIAFHAEEKELTDYFTERVKKSGRKDALAHMDSRPPITEELAVLKLFELSKRIGGKVLIVHISSKGVLDIIAKAKAMGMNFFGETCPHYLYFSSEDYAKYGSLLKVNPPIRGESDRGALLDAVTKGIISTVGSDHAPHAENEKITENIWDAKAGIIGVQTLFPSILSLALNGFIPIEKVPLVLSRNPAKMFGIWPKKGEIAVGSDGDLVIVDPKAETIIKKEDLISKSPLSPFIGLKFKGKIEKTILRGKVIFEDGELSGKNVGKWIPFSSDNLK